MLRAVARPMVRVVERWLPDSFVFAIILTFIVAAMCFTMTGSSTLEIVRGWGDGLAGLLSFMTQICLVLLLGYTLANTGPVHRFLRSISSIPSSPAAAYAFVTLVAGLASLVSFGIGLIVGGIMAVQVARSARERGVRLHYPLLVACAYSGFVVWHMGYSGSGPLAAATPGDFFEDLAPLVPVTETIFAWWNILAIVLVLGVTIAGMVLLAPKGEERIVEFDSDAASDDGPIQTAPGERESRGPADTFNGSRAVTTIIGVALLIYLAVYFIQDGFALTFDIVNWSFLAVILLFVRNAAHLAALIADAGKTVGPVLLQYPFYAGIIGMMTVTGLVEILASFFVGISTPGTLGVFTMLFAGLVNMFIPSGGGQFAVQAPIFIEAADQIGVEHEVIIMAIAYGDQWTNMIQPFWAVPLLAVAGLGIRDILGYTAITLFLSGAVMIGVLLFLGAGL
ncbi:MAG: short-chain fatty acid transporter [Rubrobacter sp.]|nr:short-chain fatty acid transporter [Rubrobacter sp.]